MSVNYDIPFRNTSGATAPPYAVMELKKPDAIFDNNGSKVLDVAKKAEDGSGLFIINGPVPVKDNQYGLATRSYGAQALYTSGSPETGESWGPEEGEWGLALDAGSIKIIGGANATKKTTRVSLTGSGKSNAAGGMAIIKGTIPPSVILDPPVDGKLFDPGILEDAATLVNPDGTEAADGIVAAENPSGTPLEAGDGLLLAGVLLDQEGTKTFVVAWPDMRGLPGYDPGTMQIPFHKTGIDQFELDATDCG